MASSVPTGASTVELLRRTSARSLMSVPSILEEISLLPDDEGIKSLVPLDFVASGGGPLKPSVGEKLGNAGVRLVNSYGVTEIGPLSVIFVPKAGYDWRYFRLRKDLGIQIEPMLVLEDQCQRFKLIARPFGWSTSFEVQDQLICNPSNPTSDFKAVGRTDDLITLATGEKVLPYVLESSLSESEHIKTAIAFGDGEFELGVIIEPAVPIPVGQKDQFKSLIWPIIVQAGHKMDNHAQITSKDAIIVAPPGTIPRSDKGSVLRKEVCKAFRANIEEVYRVLNSVPTNQSVTRLQLNTLEEDLKSFIQTSLKWKVSEEAWNVEDDLFELGMDSLQAVLLRRFLLSSASLFNEQSSKAIQIPRDFVYQHPSISKIAAAIKQTEQVNGHVADREFTIEKFVEQYSVEDHVREFPGSHGIQANLLEESHEVVLLTGSTGSLGAHLLAHIVNHPAISYVICLNRRRPGDPYQQQLQAFETKGITVNQEAWSKIRIIHIDPGASLLGLAVDKYANIRDSVTHIIHNAWPMDFKRTLQSFESQFKALQTLLNLAKDAYKVRSTVIRFLFVSSIGVVGHYGKLYDSKTVPEIAMVDARCVNAFGYGEAKLVCERIIEKIAATHSKEIWASYARVGQLTGSLRTGFWNSNEHLPALIKSSQKIAAFPKIEGTCSWLPVDCAAEILVELMFDTKALSVDSVYHLENPIRRPWHEVLNVFASALGLADADFLPFSTWLETVCRDEDTAHEEDNSNPAKALADFFGEEFERMSGGNVILNMDKTKKISPALRGLTEVSDESIRRYIHHWKCTGFLTEGLCKSAVVDTPVDCMTDMA